MLYRKDQVPDDDFRLHRFDGDANIHFVKIVINFFTAHFKARSVCRLETTGWQPLAEKPSPCFLVIHRSQFKTCHYILATIQIHLANLAIHFRFGRDRESHTQPEFLLFCDTRIIMVDIEGFKI